MVTDATYMQMALDLAAEGRGFTSPNPMVGAVVVKEGRVVGKGCHRAAGTAHAEVNALNDAGASAQNATLYVTLEPCNHTGRTPPCTEKILAAGIRRVVVAMEDPNPHVTGGGTAYLQSKGLSVDSGILQAKAEKLNEAFVKYIQKKQPFVTAKCAATLDGQLATRTGDSKWVTGAPARQVVHGLRHAADAILVGSETVKKDDPSLTTRLENRPGKDPIRVVLDTFLSIPAEAKLIHLNSEANTLIVAGDILATSVGLEKKKRIERKGVRVLRAPQSGNGIDLKVLMSLLGEMEITSLLVEGGGRVLASFFSAGLVDKIHFFYAPKLLGGSDGVPICRGAGPALMRDAIQVYGLAVQRFGQDFMLEGYINPPSWLPSNK
jgi:diaminohydroxyphosphoribosylaminopyrimidine deaminase/5-amino-6-(5-phosphoribosylamino)uracil reductase